MIYIIGISLFALMFLIGVSLGYNYGQSETVEYYETKMKQK